MMDNNQIFDNWADASLPLLILMTSMIEATKVSRWGARLND